MNTPADVLAKELVSWINSTVQGSGCRGVALGLSGGADSAVLAVLCQQALPGRILAVIMPCHSAEQDKEHALELAEKFSIPTVEVALDKPHDALQSVLPRFQSDAQTLADANIKPRLRMLTLYHIANQLGYMVAGASNRSELAIGYFTKYGDGGVDFMPLGNLVKTQVKELALYLGVPERIIEKPPSAGLWQGQTDEEEMGFTYEQLDSYLLTGEAAEEVKNAIESRIASSRHKLSMPPVAPVDRQQ